MLEKIEIENHENAQMNKLVTEYIQQLNDNSISQILQSCEGEQTQLSKQNQILQELDSQCNVIMDFSNLFKKKPRKKKKQTNKENNENNEKLNNLEEKMEEQEIEEQDSNVIVIEENLIIDNEVPVNLTITQEDMKQRRYLDQRRWFSLSRCQYKRSCGISSLVSVWNFLFSTLGTGDLPPISQEEALVQLGVCKKQDRYFGDVEFGAFTGNSTLIKWFRLLCKIYKVQGRAFIMWKNSGEGKTPGVDEEYALEKLKDGLRSENNGFIYHAHDHYFCPMGYEITTTRPMDAYKKMEDINPQDTEHWIFIGEISKCYPCFHIKKWKDIVKDITLGNPYYYNIRRPDKGVMERKGAVFQTGKKMGSTLHCIMQFQKVMDKSAKDNKFSSVNQVKTPNQQVNLLDQEQQEEQIFSNSQLNSNQNLIAQSQTLYDSKQAKCQTTTTSSSNESLEQKQYVD